MSAFLECPLVGVCPFNRVFDFITYKLSKGLLTSSHSTKKYQLQLKKVYIIPHIRYFTLETIMRIASVCNQKQDVPILTTKTMVQISSNSWQYNIKIWSSKEKDAILIFSVKASTVPYHQRKTLFIEMRKKGNWEVLQVEYVYEHITWNLRRRI